MQFGVAYHTAFHGYDPDAIIAYAKHAEDCVFESFFMPEHVVGYLGATFGSVPMDPSLPFVDPLQGLGFVAAATERILLGTSALQLPYHHPVTLAKRLATIDVLSKGRRSQHTR
jgi:alkanesulfonate monooxygenase SsuD/methylene tetrahydromethanopterin reductase-like flavin-dependent oxidoreductase (luciferase family)